MQARIWIKINLCFVIINKKEWRIGCPKRSSLKNWKGREEGGRLRKRWKEEVERDLQVLGVRRWRELVADREKWKGIVRHTQVKMERGSRKRSSSAGNEKMERVGGR